jgi:hypothetical protein
MSAPPPLGLCFRESCVESHRVARPRRPGLDLALPLLLFPGSAAATGPLQSLTRLREAERNRCRSLLRLIGLISEDSHQTSTRTVT